MDTEKRRRNKVFDEIYCSGQSIADIFFCVIAIWLGPDIALHKEARSREIRHLLSYRYLLGINSTCQSKWLLEFLIPEITRYYLQTANNERWVLELINFWNKLFEKFALKDSDPNWARRRKSEYLSFPGKIRSRSQHIEDKVTSNEGVYCVDLWTIGLTRDWLKQISLGICPNNE